MDSGLLVFSPFKQWLTLSSFESQKQVFLVSTLPSWESYGGVGGGGGGDQLHVVSNKNHQTIMFKYYPRF